MNPFTHLIPAGFGFHVGADFVRALADIPASPALFEASRAGCVAAYIAAQPNASVACVRTGNVNGLVRIDIQARYGARSLPVFA